MKKLKKVVLLVIAFLFVGLIAFIITICINSPQLSEFFSYEFNEPKESVEKMKITVSSDSSTDVESLTYTACCSDMNELCHLFKTSYVGYEDMVSKGFSEIDFLSNAECLFSEKIWVDIEDIIDFWVSYLKKYINDGHISLRRKSDCFRLMYDSQIRYSDCFVHESDGQYVIVKTDNPNYFGRILPSIQSKNLFRYPAKGEDIFRIGLLTSEDESKLEIDGCLFSISRTTSARQTSIYQTMASNNTLYVSFPRMDSEASILLEEYSDEELKSFDTTVFDLRGNPGGDAKTVLTLLLRFFLNDGPEKEKEIQTLIEQATAGSYFLDSPYTIEQYKGNTVFYALLRFFQLNPHKGYIQLNKTNTEFNQFISSYSTDFHNRILFLIDEYTCSAAEYFVLLAKLLFSSSQISVIGENSSGGLLYGAEVDYKLSESGLVIGLPSGKIPLVMDETCFWGEGVGIYPDYWSSTEDLNDTIYFVTGDLKMRSLLTSLF